MSQKDKVKPCGSCILPVQLKTMFSEFKAIRYQEKIIFAKAVMTELRRMPKYFEADESCFMFLSKGAFRLRTPDRIIDFIEGDGMLAKCGPYYVEKAKDNEGASAVIAVYFHPSIVKGFFPIDLSLAHFKPNYNVNKMTMDSMLKIFMDGIDFLLENPQVCNNELILLKLKELLLLLAQSEQVPSVQHFIASLFQPYEYDFRATILQNSTSNLSLPELAKLCNMSLATFKRRFNAVFGESPAQYLLKTKLQKASTMLSNTKEQLRIADIAYDCGFDTVTHFNKAFKKQYGLSPTEFKLSQKSKVLSL